MATYQFPCWWGGAAQSDAPPQIAEKLPQLRKLVGGLKAEKKQGGPRFAVKSSKDLMDKLRPALDDLGMVDFPVSLTGGNVPLEDSEGTMAFLMVTIRIGAPDGSYVDIVGAGHGADQQDKAGGKASTYAWKDAHVKGLDLPDADLVDTDDEEKPIKAGVKQKSGKPKAPPPPTRDFLVAAIEAAATLEELSEASFVAKTLAPEDQVGLKALFLARKAAIQGAA